MKPKNILVLGAGGFLGANLCKQLIKLNHNVVAISRSKSYDDPFVGTKWIFEKIENLKNLKETTFGDIDICYYLGGHSEPAIVEKNRRQSSISTISNIIDILELCLRNNINRMVVISSGGTVYGDVKLDELPINELALPRPISAYGINKTIIENYCNLYNHQFGMSNICIRLSNPYGPYHSFSRSQGVIPLFIRKIINNETISIWGDGSAIRDYIYVADAVDFLVSIMNYSGDENIFNVGSGIGRSISQVVEDLEFVLNINADKSYLTQSSYNVNANVLDISRAKELVDWSPSFTWEDSLELTINWVKSKAG